MLQLHLLIKVENKYKLETKHALIPIQLKVKIKK